MVNNLNPGYNVNGSRNTSSFTVPPQTFPTIAQDGAALTVDTPTAGRDYGVRVHPRLGHGR